jgi:hypothetical protein
MILLPAAVELSRVSHSTQDSRGIAESVGILLAILGVAATCWLLVYLWNRYRYELAKAASDPRDLFYELCRVHGLNRQERNLLWSAAVQHRLEHPALVFALPHYLHELAASHQPRSASYARLEARLFGSSGEWNPPADPDDTAEDASTSRS